MPSVCFYFQVHQPYRIKKYSFFDIGKDDSYFNRKEEDNLNNKWVMKKVAKKCYLPTNKILLELFKKHPDFKVSFSFSGIALEQMEKYSPETLKSFQDLVETGQAEVMCETYYHSLAFLYSKEEFREQIGMNRKKIKELFSAEPRVFRCTELAYSNDIAKEAEEMGFDAVLGEGVDHILGWRNPNFIYKPKGSDIKLFLKNYLLSDDIAFRFSEKEWKEHPLTAEKFANWVSDVNGNGEVVNLFMDYETFGEHQWEESGIFKFLEALPEKILGNKDNNFLTLSEAVEKYSSKDEVDVPYITSWADLERDLSAWTGNEMQKDALRNLYEIKEDVLATRNKKIIDIWRRFQTSDQVYYMGTKGMRDGDVHNYFSPYESPYDAFMSFNNALSDFKLRVQSVLNK
ncbi:MAG: glycoside hydrolase family 57 protein [Patescibacteria group bacterium]|nr:glycoside hydrolase family 57 protein [Patescibacteria group bacterium]